MNIIPYIIEKKPGMNLDELIKELIKIDYYATKTFGNPITHFTYYNHNGRVKSFDVRERLKTLKKENIIQVENGKYYPSKDYIRPPDHVSEFIEKTLSLETPENIPVIDNKYAIHRAWEIANDVIIIGSTAIHGDGRQIFPPEKKELVKKLKPLKKVEENTYETNDGDKIIVIDDFLIIPKKSVIYHTGGGVYNLFLPPRENIDLYAIVDAIDTRLPRGNIHVGFNNEVKIEYHFMLDEAGDPVWWPLQDHYSSAFIEDHVDTRSMDVLNEIREVYNIGISLAGHPPESISVEGSNAIYATYYNNVKIYKDTVYVNKHLLGLNLVKKIENVPAKRKNMGNVTIVYNYGVPMMIEWTHDESGLFEIYNRENSDKNAMDDYDFEKFAEELSKIRITRGKPKYRIDELPNRYTVTIKVNNRYVTLRLYYGWTLDGAEFVRQKNNEVLNKIVPKMYNASRNKKNLVRAFTNGEVLVRKGKTYYLDDTPIGEFSDTYEALTHLAIIIEDNAHHYAKSLRTNNDTVLPKVKISTIVVNNPFFSDLRVLDTPEVNIALKKFEREYSEKTAFTQLSLYSNSYPIYGGVIFVPNYLVEKINELEEVFDEIEKQRPLSEIFIKDGKILVNGWVDYTSPVTFKSPKELFIELMRKYNIRPVEVVDVKGVDIY